MCNLHSNVLRKDIEKIFEIIFDELAKALCRGENIEIRGFGTYKVKKRKARTGRNPQTGKELKIAAKKVPAFRAGKSLKEAVA